MGAEAARAFLREAVSQQEEKLATPGAEDLNTFQAFQGSEQVAPRDHHGGMGQRARRVAREEAGYAKEELWIFYLGSSGIKFQFKKSSFFLREG